MLSCVSYKVDDGANGIAISLCGSVPSEQLDPTAIASQVARMKLAIEHFARLTGLARTQSTPGYLEAFIERFGGHCHVRFEGGQFTDLHINRQSKWPVGEKDATSERPASDPLDAALEATGGDIDPDPLGATDNDIDPDPLT